MTAKKESAKKKVPLSGRADFRFSPEHYEFWTDEYGNAERQREWIDPMVYLNPEKLRERALDALEVDGVPARAHLAGPSDEPLTSLVWDLDNGFFSKRGRAASIVVICSRILDQRLSKDQQALLYDGYQLGLLAALDHVDAIDNAMRKKGPQARAKIEKDKDDDWRKKWIKFRREIRGKKRMIPLSPQEARKINATADKKLRAWLLKEKKIDVTVESIANRRSRKKWLTT